MTITNRKQLNKRGLSKGDKVQFDVPGGGAYLYEVRVYPYSYYIVLNGLENDIIFRKLGIPNKYEFVENVVGYEASPGVFPEVKSLSDLTKVVDALYKEIEKREYYPVYLYGGERIKERIGMAELQDGMVWKKGYSYIETKKSKTNKNKSFMNKLTTTLKRVLSKELQTQFKAGLRNDDLSLSERGREELFELLADEYKKELTKVAEEIIEEEE